MVLTVGLGCGVWVLGHEGHDELCKRVLGVGAGSVGDGAGSVYDGLGLGSFVLGLWVLGLGPFVLGLWVRGLGLLGVGSWIGSIIRGAVQGRM